MARLARRHPKVRFGAPVHTYRKDAVAELERCVGLAVLLKWLPIVQNFDQSDERCVPLYEALAHHLPLVCHTGVERSLPNLNADYADPQLLVAALRRGVTVIAAHCGTRDQLGMPDDVPAFARLVREHVNLHGDTAMLNNPLRCYVDNTILNDEVVRSRPLHGSDWPMPPVPTKRIGWLRATRLVFEKNRMLRDVLVKQRLGLDEYWHRAARVIRMPADPRATAAGMTPQ